MLRSGALPSLLVLVTPSMPTSAPTPASDRLEPCPETPNCVSTQAQRADQRMDPIPFSGDPEAVRERILEILAREPRVRIDGE